MKCIVCDVKVNFIDWLASPPNSYMCKKHRKIANEYIIKKIREEEREKE